jgi:hypothetical protein
MLLLLASSILLVFALEEGGTRYPWQSAAILAPLIIALVAGIAFAFWEYYLDKSSHKQEPVLPPILVKERMPCSLLL